MKENKTPQPSNPIPGNAPFFSKEKERDVERADSPEPFFTKPALRMKAEVSQPDDPQEREADQVAEKIMRMPESQVVDKKEEPHVKKETPVPAKLDSGNPLPGPTREFFGKRLGTDLSEVKIHTGDKAAQSAKEIQAKAYTSGNHVVFAKGQYAPDTEAGKKLLAHELTHVLQQEENGSKPDGTHRKYDDFPISQQELAEMHKYRVNRVASVTKNWDMLNTFDQTPSFEYIDCFLRSIIAENGFNFADNFYSEYMMIADSEQEEQHRRSVRPMLRAGLDNLRKEANAFIEGSFFNEAKSFVLLMLKNSEVVVEADARKFGLAPTGMANYGPIADSYMESLGIEANKILDSLQRTENLKKRMEQLKVSVYERDLDQPKVRIKVGERITDPALYEKLSEELKNEEKHDAVIRFTAEQQFPILASFRPEDKLSDLEHLAQGKKDYGKNLWILLDDINEKRDSIEKIRNFLNEESKEEQLEFFLKHGVILTGTKASLSVFPKSFYDQALNEKVSDVKSTEIITSLGIALLSLIGAALAAVPTGGGSLVAWGAAITGGGILVGTGVYSINKSLEQYNLEKAASGTAFDKAKAISAEEPSAFFLALEIVFSMVDIFQALAVFTKARHALKAAKDLNSAAESIYASDDIFKARFKSVDEVKEFLRANSVEKTHFFGETWKAREGLVQQLKSGEHPKLQQLIAGDEAELKTLLKSHGDWKELITGLNEGTKETKEIAKKLKVYRETIVASELKAKFRAQIKGVSSDKPVSDIDFVMVSDDLVGAGQKMVDAEIHMQKLYGEGWSETMRINFYPDLESRLLIMDKVMKRVETPEELARITLEQSYLSTKFNLARELQSAVNNPSRLANTERRIKDLGYDLRELKKLASTDEFTMIAKRNELNSVCKKTSNIQ
jgi:hypothetical protein